MFQTNYLWCVLRMLRNVATSFLPYIARSFDVIMGESSNFVATSIRLSLSLDQRNPIALGTRSITLWSSEMITNGGGNNTCDTIFLKILLKTLLKRIFRCAKRTTGSLRSGAQSSSSILKMEQDSSKPVFRILPFFSIFL